MQFPRVGQEYQGGQEQRFGMVMQKQTCLFGERPCGAEAQDTSSGKLCISIAGSCCGGHFVGPVCMHLYCAQIKSWAIVEVLHELN